MAVTQTELLSEEDFRAVVMIVRTADKKFIGEGGGTRHWVRDFFLPMLDAAGYQITKKP